MKRHAWKREPFNPDHPHRSWKRAHQDFARRLTYEEHDQGRAACYSPRFETCGQRRRRIHDLNEDGMREGAEERIRREVLRLASLPLDPRAYVCPGGGHDYQGWQARNIRRSGR